MGWAVQMKLLYGFVDERIVIHKWDERRQHCQLQSSRVFGPNANLGFGHHNVSRRAVGFRRDETQNQRYRCARACSSKNLWPMAAKFLQPSHELRSQFIIDHHGLNTPIVLRWGQALVLPALCACPRIRRSKLDHYPKISRHCRERTCASELEQEFSRRASYPSFER